MKVDHLQDGSFKRILAHRNKFPRFSPRDLEDCIVGENPMVEDLREIKKYAPVCEHMDKICELIGVPPLNILWVPNYPFVKAYLTKESNSLLFAGPLHKIRMDVVIAIGCHEFAHGFQGDLEEAILKFTDTELERSFRHGREWRSDVFAALFGSWQGAHDMLFLFEEERARLLDNPDTELGILQSSLEATEKHPPLFLRRLSIIGIEWSKEWHALIESSPEPRKLIEALCYKKSWVDVIKTPEEKRRALDFVNSAPFHGMFLTPADYPSEYLGRR